MIATYVQSNQIPKAFALFDKMQSKQKVVLDKSMARQQVCYRLLQDYGLYMDI